MKHKCIKHFEKIGKPKYNEDSVSWDVRCSVCGKITLDGFLDKS